MPAPLAFDMDIRNFIITGNEKYPISQTKIDINDGLSKLVTRLLASKSTVPLAVYENGIYIGQIPVLSIIEYMFEKLREEHSARFELTQQLRIELSKLRNTNCSALSREQVDVSILELIKSLEMKIRGDKF